MLVAVNAFTSLQLWSILTPLCCRVAETGVQNTPLMIAVVGLAFSGCQQQEVLVFVLAASLYYIFHSLWYVLLLRCVFAQWCDKTFADDEARCLKSTKYLCASCRCCLKPTYIQQSAEVVEPKTLSAYISDTKDFKTTDGTAELPVRLSEKGTAYFQLLLRVYPSYRSSYI